MSIHAQRKGVDFEERGAPNRIFQNLQMVQMCLLVPEDFAVFDVRPIHDFGFRQREVRARDLDQLYQRLRPIEQPGRRVSHYGDSILRERELVRLLCQCRPISVLGIAHPNRVLPSLEPNRRSAAAITQLESVECLELFPQNFDRDVAGRDSRANLHSPGGRDFKVTSAQFHLLRLWNHRVASGIERRDHFRV